MSNMDKDTAMQNINTMFNTTNDRTTVEPAEKPKSEVDKLNESTEIMNKETVERKIKEFRDALKNRFNNEGRIKLNQLSEDFDKINKCLIEGEESLDKEALLKKRRRLELDKAKDGATALNIAKLKNNEAKLNIIKYKDIIAEAAISSPSDNLLYINDGENKKRTGIITGVIIGALATGIAGVYGYNRIMERINKLESNSTNVTTESGLDGDATASNSSEDSVTITTSTGDYSIETVGNDGYTSPTRATTTEGENGNSNGTDATVVTVRPTTNPSATSVISAPTDHTPAPTENTTTTVQTDVNGTQPGHTEPEVKPTGTDPLPVEPTRVTVDVTSDPTTAPTEATTKPTEATTKPTEATTKPTEATTKPTEGTTKPRQTEPRSTTVEVPVVTVDPDDPANVKEKAKKLTLRKGE